MEKVTDRTSRRGTAVFQRAGQTIGASVHGADRATGPDVRFKIFVGSGARTKGGRRSYWDFRGVRRRESIAISHESDFFRISSPSFTAPADRPRPRATSRIIEVRRANKASATIAFSGLCDPSEANTLTPHQRIASEDLVAEQGSWGGCRCTVDAVLHLVELLVVIRHHRDPDGAAPPRPSRRCEQRSGQQ